MIAETIKRKSWKKKLLISGLILLLALGGIYWYVATEKFSDTKKVKPDYTVNAIEFIREFLPNDDAANKKYTDRIITVKGIVSEVEAADTTVNIKFIDPASGSDRKSTRLNSSHSQISYAVFCLKKKKTIWKINGA